MGDLKSVWSPSKRRKVSRKLAVGDSVQLYYTYNNEDGEEWTEMYDAVVTKVNLKTFKAVCEGEEPSLTLTWSVGPSIPRGCGVPRRGLLWMRWSLRSLSCSTQCLMKCCVSRKNPRA